MPVSERQQFALLKLMETKNPSSERSSKQVWDGQERESGQPRSNIVISSSLPKQQSSGGNSSLPPGSSTPNRYSCPQPEPSHQTERSSSSHNHPHGHHGHANSSSHNSTSISRKSSQQQQNAPILTQQHRVVTPPESPLMRAAKKGDILTLKMLIKEGSDVNEQDSNVDLILAYFCNITGRTPLHESSSQNYIHLVSYLLKHNANPNIRAVPRGGSGGGSGDTPLHEASREGHARIVRALLRYGADYKICNNNGDRPIDVCSNESSQMVFKNINQSREYPGSTPGGPSSSLPIKKLAAPKSSSPPSSSEGYHQGRGSFEESGNSNRRTSPDLAGSSPATSQSFRTSNSPHHHHHHKHHSPSVVRRNTVSGPAPSVDPAGNIHQLPRFSTKKDPYAFDDEELETPLQPSQEVTTVPNAVASTSSSPLHSHRIVTGGSGCFMSGTVALHVNTTTTTSGESTLHSGPSSAVSPSTLGLGAAGGPPLKLRFAMEAGHYTLMENQENASVAESGEGGANLIGDAVSGEMTSTPTIIDVTPGASAEAAALLLKSEEHSQTVSTAVLDGPLKLETGSDQKVTGGTDEAASDDGRSPKVPPLRIKLGSNTPPSQTETGETVTNPISSSPNKGSPGVEKKHLDSDGANEEDEVTANSISQSSATAGQDTEPLKVEVGDDTTGGGEWKEENVEEESKGGESGGRQVEEGEEGEKKSGDSTPASTSTSTHPTRRGPGSCTGRTGKAASTIADSANTTSGKRHASSESGDSKSKDSSDMKAEEPKKTRTFRTLRSHTAAQREKEEREKNSEVTPPKKRKYRSRGGGGGGGGGGNSGAEVGFGGDNDTGKFTDHEDTGGTNEASSMRSGSTNGDGGMSTVAGGGDDDIQSAGEGTSTYGNSGRVFDDPNKPSSSGWGENPYDKAAELNRGFCELIGKLVELQPKEPAGYQDYLLVTRDYLLAGYVPQYISRRPCPPELPPPLIELFEEQEDERYAQALKHQSEREQLRLCAEQSVLRAQTRATIALANQPRPLSFCSVLALKGFTYLPSFKDSEHRASLLSDEESVRDRFKARTLIGWLQDIKDNFHAEKKKLLCRQLHEAESLMMVQKLDWEVKLKELHIHDYRASIFDQIPTQHVPLIGVPSDFPLFVHDPIQRPS
ncbi:unnamed protein product [Hymenolepis diminuta]|uniref:ANK_REP_REGION domain-containing protein n=1 Tax=Hymenolepis diminuta TaxID=6216 RepID=A0A0R3SQ36_HYMDI|nr:unnamed protein product [Hymenolepis diminuta]